MNLDLDVEKFIKTIENQDSKPLYELSPEQARKVLLKIQSSPKKEKTANSSEISVPLNKERSMRVKIIKPLHQTNMLPIVYYIHGGGWVMGNEETHAHLVNEIALQTNSAVVFPIYEPSPETQYPQTTTDLFTVLRYIVQNATTYGLDSRYLCVAGDSAGANMALVMALMAKENKNPKITFQLLIYPVASADFDTDSYHTYQNGPWLSKKAMQWFWNQYAPEIAKRKEIHASPLHASLKQLQGLPATLVITDQNDVLRDEGEALAQKLNLAGVQTSSVRINGTIHDFLMLNALVDSAPTKAALWLISGALKSIFNQSGQ